MQDYFVDSSGKRKRDDYPSHLNPRGYIPQQDGSSDVTIEFSLPGVDAFLNFIILKQTYDNTIYRLIYCIIFMHFAPSHIDAACDWFNWVLYLE